MRDFDCIIVGQGLAGSWMAMLLARRGWKVGVVDDGCELASSRLATGLITPLTGKRLVPTWRLAQLLPAAMAAYQVQERRFGCALIERRPTLRIFSDEAQKLAFARRARDGALAAYLGPTLRPGARPLQCELPFGGCWLRKTARVRVQHWLALVREALWREGVYRQASLGAASMRRTSQGFELLDWRAKRLVLCQGYRAHTHPWLSFARFRNARGDLVTVKAPYASHKAHLQTGVSLVALGRGHAVLGGNYDWNNPQATPSPQDARRLKRVMESSLGQSLCVLRHRAGVRPVVQGRLPLVGAIPDQPGAYVLNGLASKGTLWAPSVAKRLRDIMDGVAEPDPELDARFTAQPRRPHAS